MPTRRFFLRLSALAFGATLASFAGVDSTLLALAPPDATVLSGVSVDQAKASVFGQYMLSQMTIDDAGFQTFINDTGFDPRRDLSQILSATSGDSTSNQTVIIGRGSFNTGKIANAGQADGAKIINYKGVDMIVHSGTNMTGALAFLDAQTAVMGYLDSVKAVIDRRGQTTSALPAAMLASISTLASANDAWFLSTVSPAVFFASKINSPTASPAIEAGLIQAVLAGNGGLKFTPNGANITAQAVARSDKDATALADVFRFLVSIVQSSASTDPNAAKFGSLLNNLQISTQGPNMNLALSIPETTLEQLFMTKHGAKSVAAVGRR